MSRRRIRGALVGALLVGLVGWGTANPAAATTRPTGIDRVGVVGNLIFSSESETTRELQRLRAGGVQWDREAFYWSLVEPARGRFDWRRSDALMTGASVAGVNVLAILAFSAPWASSDPSGRGRTNYPPRDPADFARYATAVVQRYGPGGSFWAGRPTLTPRPLQAVEIWNEPWWHGFWAPQADPAGYAALVRAAGDGIRELAPGVSILVSGDLLAPGKSQSVPWLTRLLAVHPSVAPYVDAWAVHPYPDPKSHGPRGGPIEYSYERVPVIAQTVAAAGVARPIWITEIGWSSAPHASGGVSEATQARFLHDALVEALTTWRATVARTFVYQWSEDSKRADDLEGHFALLGSNGRSKPAWNTVQQLARR
jgi:polysaccharide biosynthesis protein PslG